jgi:hypothetical protein
MTISRVLSWTIIRLGQQLLIGSSFLPGSDVGHACISRILEPYLKLLRVEFTVPRTITSRAVRSYRTLSPLPVQAFTNKSKSSAVYSLLHWSWARAPQTLSGTLPSGARTFLPFVRLHLSKLKRTTTKQRLPGHLAAAIITEAKNKCALFPT